MDIESTRWEEWEQRFRALAERAEPAKTTPDIGGSRHYLCLYGENGLPPEQEFTELEMMETLPGGVMKVDVDTAYWQDTVLFVP